MIDGDHVKLWLPTKPAIIRPARKLWRPPVDYKIRGMLPGLIAPIAGAAIPDATVSYRTTVTSTTDGLSFTFNSVDLGSVGEDRVIACICTWTSSSMNPVLTGSPTIDGASATIVAGNNGTADGGIGMIYVNDPTGALAASGTIVVSMSRSCLNMAVSVFDIRSYVGLTDNANGSASGSTNAVASDCEIISGGILIAGAMSQGAGTFTGTWSGADTPTERIDQNLESRDYAAWDMVANENLTTGDFTFALSVSATKRGMCASWR